MTRTCMPAAPALLVVHHFERSRLAAAAVAAAYELVLPIPRRRLSTPRPAAARRGTSSAGTPAAGGACA